MKVNWEGIYPAVTTKFKANESLDFAAFEQNINAQIEAGIDGVVVGGSLGENSTLSHNEKQQLLRSALSASGGRVPVILCIAEQRTADALKFVADAEKNEADGFMLLPPMRYPADDRETVHYLKTVAGATHLPIMLYNNPLAYTIMIKLDMLAELAEVRNIEAIKESSGDVRYLSDIINRFGDRFSILTGVDDLAMEALVMGATGWVAGLVCAFPAETVAIYRLIKAGRIEEARDIYRWFLPLLHLDVSTKLVQNIKLAEVHTGLGTEHVRQPRLPLTGTERTHVEKVITDALANRPILPDYMNLMVA
ncbi:MAG: dihydrodipicolinate synthase family protein [Bacteroidota bacterium]